MNDSPKTFVSLGNATQPFHRLLGYLNEVYDELPKPILIQNGSTFFDKPGYEIQNYLSPKDYYEAINSAEILIVHAGAGSVINAVKVKKKPIVVPRLSHIGEHVNDHQINFAIAMCDSGYVHLAQNQIEFNLAISKVMCENTSTQNLNHHNIQELVAKVLAKYSVK